MGGDPPATTQSLHAISFKSYRGWHLQPLSVHRAEYRLFTISASQRRQKPISKQKGFSESCMLLLARVSAWSELSQRSSLLPNRLRQPVIETSWRYCRSGQTAMVLRNWRERRTLSASILPSLWLRYTSNLLVVCRITNSRNAAHRSLRINRQRWEVSGAARRMDHELLRGFKVRLSRVEPRCWLSMYGVTLDHRGGNRGVENHKILK